MTPAEIERFIKAQLNMGARIAQKANRARIAAAAFTNVKSASGPSLGDKIIAALDRPGVAPSSRPLSKEGAQTFHFALTTVSRTSEFAARTKNDLAGKAGDHMSYIEREGAAETLDADVKREADAIDREAWAILGGQDYIERPGAAEVLTDGRTIASFGNIAATLEERVAYWTALEEAAPKPKTHGIVADRTKDPAFWAQVDSDPGAPAILRSTPPWIALPVHQTTPNAEHLNRPVPVPRVTDKIAIAVAQYAAKHRSRSRIGNPAVTIDPGRGGRIQNRIIVELPYELSPEGRLKLARDFCHRHFVGGREKPLPHWCVIHAPDHHNDPRNTHMHIVFAERPTERVLDPITGKEVWDFEVIEEKKDKHRNRWTTRPLEQPADRTLQDRSWVKKARASYAELANEALLAAGKSKIYDARSYKAMGIDVDPRKRINGKDYIKEKKGISTKAGTPAVLEQWRREEERLSARHPSFDPDTKVMERFNKEIQRWQRSSTSTRLKLLVLRHEWKIAQAHRKYHAAEAAANALIMRKIKSKLAPPLGADEQTTRDATVYLRMFKTDLIDKHGKAAQLWRRNEQFVLRSLRQAELADPKTATTATFLEGSAVVQAANGFMTAAKIRAASGPPQTLQQMLNTQIIATRTIVDEERTIASEIEKLAAIRHGRVEDYPLTPSDHTTPDTLAVRATESKTRNEPFQVPDPATLPAWRADGKGRHEIRPPPIAGDASSAAPKTQVPEAKPSDEKGLMFFSDTGAPVQRRVISASMIKRAEERAASIIAAAHQRRAEREEIAKALREAEEKAARNRARIERAKERSAAAAARVAAEGARTQVDARPGPTAAIGPVDGPQTAPPRVPPRTIEAAAGIASAAVAPEATRPHQGADQQTDPRGPRSTTPSPSLAAQAPNAVEQTTRTHSGIGPTDASNPKRETLAPSPTNPLLDTNTTVYQPNRTHPATIAPAPAAPDETTPKGASMRIEDIEVTDAPPEKKKRVLTAEQLRQRALLAAKNRGRGR